MAENCYARKNPKPGNTCEDIIMGKMIYIEDKDFGNTWVVAPEQYDTNPDGSVSFKIPENYSAILPKEKNKTLMFVVLVAIAAIAVYYLFFKK